MDYSVSSDSEKQICASSSLCVIENNDRASFEYSTLSQTVDSFRLFKILPDRSPGGQLQLTLWHDVVSSASYHCLSYRWGDQTRHSAILLNGNPFAVGKNLYSFLEEMYTRAQRPGVQHFEALWVDSISINQDSLRERAQQVQRMGSIYEGAEGVLVWLGEQSISDDLHAWAHSPPKSIDSDGYSDAMRHQWSKLRSDAYWSRAWM